MIVSKTFEAKGKPAVHWRGTYVSIETTGTAREPDGREVAALRIEEYHSQTTSEALKNFAILKDIVKRLCRADRDPGFVGRDRYPELKGLGYGLGIVKA